MSTYTPWTWSLEYQRHYMYRLGNDGTILETLWAGPAGSPEATTSSSSVANDPRTPRSSGTQTTYNAQDSRSIPQSSPSGTYSTTNVQAGYYDAPTTTQCYAGSYSSASVNTNANQYLSSGYHTGTNPSPGTGFTNLGSHHASSSTYPSSIGAGYGTNTVASSSSPPANPPSQLLGRYYPAYQPGTAAATSNNPRTNYTSLPDDVQNSLGGRDQRFIRTGIGVEENVTEPLDPRYRRVSPRSYTQFFVPGRVFKMLWIEPAGIQSPGKTRGSTHFSFTVKYGEEAFCEIRRFVVVRNRGTFSQCIPIQTYRGQGATKPGLIAADHGVIHTTETAPNLMPGEGITKFSIRVVAAGEETLHHASRVNYGKPYAVEHNVKVLEVGMVTEQHRYLIPAYFDLAMRGE